ncbi:unnamed protein product [Ambrosiozyma monospora]|uniref:Unnamed protein product n=1 Tax=Ambrosiozyma monospora TaxID=43982 RepID=A0A9W6Z9R8_AMBMO|nr:unnamed protein product [Ambrosiozyma monospora]
MVFSIAGSVWFGAIQTPGDVYGSQLFIGIAEGSTEALVPFCLASIFFRHQLGSVITMYVLSYALGTYLGPLIANYISIADSFRWVGWSGAIASAITLLLVFFFFEEDLFDYSLYQSHRDNLLMKFSLMQKGIRTNDADIELGYHELPWSVAQRLAPVTINAHQSHDIGSFCKQYFKLLYLNLKTIYFPPVLLAGLNWGLQSAILSFYLTTEDTYLYDPPFNYSGSKVALMNIPCLIGAVIGCLYAGSLTDYFILWIARRKKGVVESEYRLVFNFLSGILGCAGLLMFGFGISKNLDWRVHYIGLGLIGYLFSSSCNITMLYVIDTYDQLILESLAMVGLINNIMGCIFTFACSPWLDSSGTQNTYIV